MLKMPITPGEILRFPRYARAVKEKGGRVSGESTYAGLS